MPTNTDVTYDQTKRFAKTVAETMEKHHGDRVVSKMTKSLRAGKVLIDLFAPVLEMEQALPSGPGGKTTVSKEPLRTYHEKRDFVRTPEPAGGAPDPRDGPIFVIHKHAATRLHYDLRLEVDGVLKSWSVPRGPSSQPADRRLAVEVEDHPLDYRDFEGVIPKGQYGAGRVIIWDRGTYRNITDNPRRPTPMARAIEHGKVEIIFEGHKMKGGYALIRMERPGQAKNNWLLIKLKDEHVGALPEDLEDQPQSVATGRTLDDLRAPSARPKK